MTLGQARDEAFAMFRVAWMAAAGAVVSGNPPPVLWQGQQKDDPPDNSVAYARATVLHSTRRQASLSGADGRRRWVNVGIVVIQCFGPLSSGNGLTVGEALATIAKNAFEGKASPGGIWFRNCRCNEVGPSDGWYQVNAVAEFTYDDVR